MRAYPICFVPVYRDYVWGGRRIGEKYERSVEGRVAESWEVADREEGMSVVENGEFKGRSLRELVGEELVGRKGEAFPLLVKVLDARENLSVQVHPNDETAALVGGEAKSEMWYVLEAEEGAFVYAGVKGEWGGKIEDALEKVEVKAGDAVYVPGGCVHAIGAGCLLFEVQQNSNTTYRMHDWGRGRELHMEKALRVMNRYVGKKEKVEKIGEGHWSVVSSPYFQVEKLEVGGDWEMKKRQRSFQIFFCLSGDGEIVVDGRSEALCPGRSYLVPACFKSGRIWGKAEVIRVTL